MGWPYVNSLLCFCLDPSTENAPACKRQSVNAVIVDDRELEVAVERCGRNRLPAHGWKIHVINSDPALIQVKGTAAT
jgi:hypothetical protein